MECRGCSACAVICPRRCITMKRNREGFLRPAVDRAECVGCRLCEKVCSLRPANVKKLDEAKLYSAYAKDGAVRRTSSSGGIAALLALAGVAEKKLVCGAAFDYSALEAKHVLCAAKEELEALKGSKYLQSDCSAAFAGLIRRLKADARLNAAVFGTPCQISGLNNVLLAEGLRERATLVDIFCHGVPSQLLWEEYLTWLEKKKGARKEEIEKLIFRDKAYSWHTYYMHVFHARGEYVADRNKDPFLRLFTAGVCNQKECFTCPFRNGSAADIRLGDFWGERYAASEDGYSMVLLLTRKGREAFEALRNVEKIELPVEERLCQQHTDYAVPSRYDRGLRMLAERGGLEKLVNLHDPPHGRAKRAVKRRIKRFLSGA